MTKSKLIELNAVRAIAILAVMLIHTTASATVAVKWGNAAAPVYLIANQLSMFAVPVFILLSGLVLFYRYHDSWSWSQAVTFYKKRTLYILIPYLIWSLFYDLFNQYVYKHQLTFDFVAFLKQVQWGWSSYHLYYMVIIIQFYAAFPLLLTVVRKLRMSAKGLILFGLIAQALFYMAHLRFGPIDHLASLLPNYLLVFTVGGAIGMAYKEFFERSRHVWWTFALGISVGFIYLLMIIASKSGAHYPGQLYVIFYNLYAVLIGISLIWIMQKFSVSGSKLFKLLSSLGASAFGIYLIHPAVLTVWSKFIHPVPYSVIYHLANLGSFLAILVVSWLIVHLLKKIKISWLLFGKS